MQFIAHCLVKKTLKSDYNFAWCALNALCELVTPLKEVLAVFIPILVKSPKFSKMDPLDFGVKKTNMDDF